MFGVLILVVVVSAGRAAGQSLELGTLPKFGEPDTATQRLPGFGEMANLPQVIDKDRSNASSAMKKVDSNKDGLMGREELRDSRYKKYEQARFVWDFDRNNKLTADELAHYYASLREGKEQKAKDKARAEAAQVRQVEKAVVSIDSYVIRQLNGSEIKLKNHVDLNTLLVDLGKADNRSKVTAIVWTSNGRSLVVHQPGGAAQAVVNRYDRNGSGQLEREEWQRIEGTIKRADTNLDETVTHEEVKQWLARENADSGRETSRDWFIRKDKNRDDQVSMAEYAEDWTPDLVAEFRQLDLNRDEMITALERVTPRSGIQGRKFESNSAVIILPSIGAIGFIEIDEDFTIADIDLKLSISHSQPAQLDAYLISPEGKRVDLFRGEGKNWQGHVFNQTIFDHEAKTPIAKAVVPFAEPVLPEATDGTEKSGFASYYGERSKGVWRLVIRGDRNLQAGLLDQWALVMTAQR